MDASEPTALDGGTSESDVGVDDEELLLALQMSMTTMSPKPSDSTVLDE